MYQNVFKITDSAKAFGVEDWIPIDTGNREPHSISNCARMGCDRKAAGYGRVHRIGSGDPCQMIPLCEPCHKRREAFDIKPDVRPFDAAI